MNNGKDISTLTKAIPISEQLNVIKILSALVLCLFSKSLRSNTPLDATIANDANVY